MAPPRPCGPLCKARARWSVNLGPFNAAVLLGTAGLCLIFYELNRPGRILPGASGLLLLLLSVAAVVRVGVQAWAALVLLLCAVLQLANVWRTLPVFVLVATIALTAISLRCLAAPTAAQAVSTSIAVLCGGTVGSLSAWLGRIAFRARRAKALD